MERKSWIWGKMMYGKIQLFDSTPFLKAAAPGKRNRSHDRHGSRCRRCWLRSGRTLLLLAVPCCTVLWRGVAGVHRAAWGDWLSRC